MPSTRNDNPVTALPSATTAEPTMPNGAVAGDAADGALPPLVPPKLLAGFNDKAHAIHQRWSADRSPANLASLVDHYQGIIMKELPKYGNNLPPAVMKGYAKKFVIDAAKSYDPAKGSLTNHILLNMQRLHRINYETSGMFRMSEELQQGAGAFKGATDELKDQLHRDPTLTELADKLHWTESKVARLTQQTMKESLGGGLSYEPAHVNMDDPKLDYLYHDLTPEDKLVFQHRTGYLGAPILGVVELAQKIGSSPANVSNRAFAIAQRLQPLLGSSMGGY